ncbi:hypothetical protein CspeluHIS016_0501870 [Cutaneotrichosporon spelunceum]|uniref:Uncharacterized protein n=1 Tax=Cutaneotrichosporon spelunceum TaxID=1672016 RepID=A0AAD3TWD4_9TREE|nr:hypothetical protein CspeluHIS016_0501870 [Cutaneotrichosporon spelunceum]
MRARQLWCAVVGCPDKQKRQSFTPDGQELPEWLSWSQFVTVQDGQPVTTGIVVNLPLAYYGPSIPLGQGWSYGGSVSPTATADESTEPTASGSASATSGPRPSVPGVSLGSNLAVILPSILVPFAVLAAILLLVFCLRRKRKERQEKRTAAYREYHRSAPEWEPVPTTNLPEKPVGPSGSGGTAAGVGLGMGAGVAAVHGAEVLAAGGRASDDASSLSSFGDERSSLLNRGSARGSVRASGNSMAASRDGSYAESSSGLAGVGTAMGTAAVAVGGMGILRSLGLGKRPRVESRTNVDEQEQDEATRKVSANTMERMIGLVRPSRASKRSSATSRGPSGSEGTHNTSVDPKRSSGGTSTGAYVPVPDDELFYAPRPIMNRSADSEEVYYSAPSRNSAEEHDPGTVGTAGSNSSRSSGGHSARSKDSKSSSSKSSRGFRGAGGRVHSTIQEEGALGGPPTAAVAGGDLGLPDTPTSASFSVYDSAGSGSVSKDGQDLSEFGTRGGGGTGGRLAVPPGSSGGRYSERNSSVGTFGTPFEHDSHNRASAELLSSGGRTWLSEPAPVAAGAAAGATAAAAATVAIPWGAAKRWAGSAMPSPDSPRSGHGVASTDSTDITPRVSQVPVGLVPIQMQRSTEQHPTEQRQVEQRPLTSPPSASRGFRSGHRNSGSQEMMAAAAVALAEYQRSSSHQRAASHQFLDRTPSPVKLPRSASTSHALLAPMPGLNRSAPGPIKRPMPLAATAAVGGDMMLSPFGPPKSQGSGSNSHPSTGTSLPSAQGVVVPAPPDATVAQRSTESLAEHRHSGTSASADGSRGRSPRSTSYDDFGLQQGAASRSEPTLLLNSPPVSASEDRFAHRRDGESSSSGIGSGWEHVEMVQRLGQEWNSGSETSQRYSRFEPAQEGEPSPFDRVEPVTPERARRGEFASPRKLIQRLWR